MRRRCAWIDTGTHGSLLDAGNFERALVARQGMQMGSPKENAYNVGWIDGEQQSDLTARMGQTDAGR